MAKLTPEQLAEIDVIIAIDHSGSMGSASSRFSGKTRLEEVKEDALAIARLAEKHDTDGLTVISFASQVKVFDGVTSAKVEGVFQEFAPRGSTNLAAALTEAINKAKGSTKKTAVIVFTDGAPDDKAAATKIINDAGALTREKIGFLFIQVGNDPEATKFLASLDDDLSVDLVDTITAAEAESFEVDELIWRAFNE
jgi:uncharacterized protein with von Willebrand factor type A (vWA) domain